MQVATGPVPIDGHADEHEIYVIVFPHTMRTHHPLLYVLLGTCGPFEAREEIGEMSQLNFHTNHFTGLSCTSFAKYVGN